MNKLISIDGNVSDESNEVSVSVTTSGLTNTRNDMVEIYPNSTTGKVTFQNKVIGDINLKIMNLSGKCIMEKNFTSSVTFEKELCGDSGINLIELNSGNRKVYERLIIQ